MNKTILMGRMVRDPELRTTQSQTPVATFTVAVDRKFKNGSGERETDFISCVAWRKTGELISQYFTKGSKILVEGSLQIRSYEDKDGNNRTIAEVVVSDFDFVDSKSAENKSAPYENPEPNSGALPFDL